MTHILTGEELVPVLHNLPQSTGLMCSNFDHLSPLNGLSQNLSVSFLSGSGVTGVAATARKTRLFSPQPLPPCSSGESRGVPRPAKRYNLSSVFQCVCPGV